MPYGDPRFRSARRILEGRGEFVQPNPMRLIKEYEDKKVLIRGIIDPREEKYECLYVFINLPSNQVSSTDPNSDIPSFTLPSSKKQNQWTEVYYWYEVERYFRPGRWAVYLSDLVKELDTEYQERHKLHNSSIDDSGLFPGIELEN